MRMLIKVCLIAMLLLCHVKLGLGTEMRESNELLSSDKNTGSNIKARGSYAPANDKRPEAVNPRKKLKKTGSRSVSMEPQRDFSCTEMGGICQLRRYICRGRYLKNNCPESMFHQCCVPAGAWSVLCAGHHKNRVRACDAHGCGAFNSKRDNGLHKAVDLVCDDYGVINAPFSGSLAGPVSRKDPAGHQYDGVKLLSDVYCVKIFNIRPYHYFGPVAHGEALGYLLPLQERFSGITSHVKLQMCDGTDPSSFI